MVKLTFTLAKMDTNKVIYQNHGNWLHFVVLIDCAGSKLCKKVLHTKEGLPEDGSQLHYKLLPFKDEIEFNDQKEILCPPRGITDESKFDIALYTKLIEKMFQGKHNLLIRNLGKNRNDLHHMESKMIYIIWKVKIFLIQALRNDGRKHVICYKDMVLPKQLTI